MTKRNGHKTRKAILASVMSLLLSVSMFAGSTYAWFTDEVTSGVNQIIAGNLDVELAHTSASVADEETVDGATNLFKDKDGNDILWEPGVIAYETFTVSNVGNLALKYNLALNVYDYNTTEVDGQTYDLRTPLKVKVLETPLADVSREAVQALDWSTSQSLEDFSKEGGKLYPEGNVPTNGASFETFQVIVYWEPTDNDNLWNLNNDRQGDDALYINFGVRLVATQLDYEEDSFDETYDLNAELPQITTASASNTVTAGTTTVNLPVAPADNKSTTVTLTNLDDTTTSVQIDVETKDVLAASTTSYSVSSTDGAVASIDLSLFVTKTTGAESVTTQESTGFTAKIETYVAPGLNGVTLNYDGTDTQTYLAKTSETEVVNPGDYYYNKETGKLVFVTNHFSNYVVRSTDVIYNANKKLGYASLQAALEAVEENDKNTLLLLKDTNNTANANFVIPANKIIVFDLNGHKMNTVASDGETAYQFLNLGTLTIKDNTDVQKNGTGNGKLELNALDPDPQSIPGYASNVISNKGTLYVESGWIYNASSNGYAAFAIDNDSRSSGTNNRLVINGGKVSTYKASSIRQCVLTGSTSDVVINGGVVGSYWIQNYGTANASGKGTLTINNVEALYNYRFDLGYSIDYGYNIKGDEVIVNIIDGNFKSIEVLYNNNAKADIIKGGTFTSNVSAYCVDGYFTKAAAGKYVCVPVSQAVESDYAAYIEEVGYFDFASAKAAANGKTIKLNKDISGYLMFNDGGTHSLDLNGHNIANYSGSGNSDTINVYNNTTLTITDSSETKGTISSEVGCAIWTGSPATDTSSITLNGGINLVGATHAIESSNGVTKITINAANITGGDFAINEGSTLVDNR